MKGLFGLATGAVLFWLAGIAQQSLAGSLTVLGARPDFLLIVALCIGLRVRPAAGACAGFVGGFMTGALVGADTTHYVLSRSIGGFAISCFKGDHRQTDLLSACVSVAACTVLAQLVLMFTAPPREILPYLAATIGSAVYNGVLAAPLYALWSRLYRPKSE